MKGFTLIELLVVCIIGLIGISILAVPIAKAITTIPIVYSDGERTGQIVKFSKKGILFKTWEGELNVGRSGENIPTVWQFSVRDRKVIEKIQQAQRSGNMVTLKYVEYFLVSYRDGETDYLIEEVIINERNPN